METASDSAYEDLTRIRSLQVSSLEFVPVHNLDSISLADAYLELYTYQFWDSFVNGWSFPLARH